MNTNTGRTELLNRVTEARDAGRHGKVAISVSRLYIYGDSANWRALIRRVETIQREARANRHVPAYVSQMIVGALTRAVSTENA